ncbi:MAG: FIST C-terminal domain-containing protein [Deltaproteobacteria bacterium]|nr:FIST C-terminal domain-containing protein [Deltaproteobacteria bacterium]
MKIESIVYDLGAKKWSVPTLPSRLDSERTLVFVAGPAEVLEQSQPLSELVRAFPRSHVIGCGTAGALAGQAVRDGVVAVSIVEFTNTTMSLVHAPVTATADAFSVGQQIAKKLSKPSLRGVLAVGDGLEVDGAEFVRGLNSALDQSIALFGGLAGDGTRFKRTWVLAGPSIKSGLVAAVGFYGEHVVITQSTRYGWNKVGPERTVTRSDGRVIYELDGKPALDVYEEAIAAANKGSGGGVMPIMLPLAVRATARHEKSLVRSVMGVEAQKRCLRLAVDIPQGYLVQPLVGEQAALVSASKDAAVAAKEGASVAGSDTFVFAVSHAGRRAVLGAKAGDEIAAAVGALAGDSKTHSVGFYGYGEIAASAPGHSDLHNQSISVTLVMESPTPIARKATRGLAASAARAQAPSNASGPAAHLRSRHQTVDDLFLELEIEGGKRGGPRSPGVPPPVPPRRVAPPSSPSSGAMATATALPQTRTPVPSQSPPMSTRQPIDEPEEEKTSPSLRPSEIPEHTRSRVKTPIIDARELQAVTRGAAGGGNIRAISYSAAKSAWSQPALPELDSPNTLVLAFGRSSIGEKSGPLEELAQAYPRSHIVGCGSGRLFRGALASEDDLTVTVTRFDRTSLLTAWADLATGSTAAGAALGQQLLKPELRAIIVVGDGAAVDGDALLGGLAGAVPEHVAISGGFSSADGGRVWVMANQIVRSGIVAAVGLYGKHVVVSRASRSGFEAFGPERYVTRASGRTLYELDGKSALAVYAEYLGQKIEDLAPGAPLPLPVSCKVADRAEALIRMPVAFDPRAQSVTFAGEIPSGAVVRLMRASPERLLSEARTAAAAATKTLGARTSQALVLAVSSIGRAKALGDEDVEETVSILEGLPKGKDAQVAGFYAVAELGADASGRAELANESLSLTCISENPEGAVAEAPEPTVSERRTTPAPPVHAPNPAETPSPPQVARTARAAGRARPEITRTAVSGAGAGAANAKITKAKKGDVTVVTFSGRLSESFKGESLGRELAGTVVFDLGGVERITSFGVREWLQMLAVSQERVKKIYFAHCSEAVVNQLSMIRKFAGSAQVVSFFAPYLCDSCGEQFERLFDCDLDADAIRSSDVPESVCQRCNGRGRFDDDPETYLAFAPHHLGQPVPANVRAVLDELDAQAPAPAADAIEKTIEGETTRVRVTSKLGATIRWQRILDGIEGALVIDLGGVASLDDAGVANFLHALSVLGPEVESVRLERCPQAVLEKFAELGSPKRVSITSTVVAGFCASCNVQRPALLVPDQHAHALGAGIEPVLNCKRCNGALTLIDARVVVQFLARQRRRPSLAPRASTPAPAVVSSTAPAPVVSAPAVEPAPTLSVAPPPPPAASSGRGILAGAAILSLAVLVSAGFFAYARAKGNAAEPEAASPPKSAAAPSWSPLADLPPPWVERPFVEENSMLLILGRSEKAPNAEAALAQARNEAIVRVLRQLQTEMAGGPTHEFFVSRQPADADIKKRTAAIAERYLRQVGTFAQPDRGETVVRQRDGGIEAFARYRLSRTAYAQALATYKNTVSVQGMTVARVFPTLDAPGTADVVVIGVAKGRPAEAAGIKVGDFITTAAQRPVPSLEAFGRLSDDWNQLAPGGSLDIEIENAAGKSTAKLRKPFPQVAAPPPPATPTPHRDPPPPQKPPKDLGIIPPPRNF